MNKRGVIGRFIAIGFVTLLIFVIMGIFVGLAAGGSITKSKGIFNTETITGSNLMEREVIISEEKISVSSALSNFADVYVDYESIFAESPELAKAKKEDEKYNGVYIALLDGLKDFINLDAEVSGTDNGMCLVLSAKVGEQFGRNEFSEIISYPPKANFAEGATVFYIERRSSGRLGVFSKDFGIPKTTIGGEGVIILKNYYKAVTSFSLLTEKGNELNGVYYYGRCLKK